MSNTPTVLVLDERTKLGKGLGDLRRGGVVPAVIHDHGKPSMHVQGSTDLLAKAYRDAGKNHTLELQVGDKKFVALIKDVTYRPPKHSLQHIVFQAVAKDEKVEAEIPIHLIGNPPAERLGFMVLHQLDSILVEAIPSKLPDRFELDAERLADLQDKLTVADITVPEGVIILTDAEHAIATVVETRANLVEEVEEVEGGEETAEGEGETEEAVKEE